MKKELINQPYKFTVSHYVSDTHIERIMTRIIEVLQPSMVYKEVSQSNNIFDNRVITLKNKLLLPEGSRNHHCVKRALDKMMSCKIKIQGNDKKGEYELFTGLISKYKYYKNSEYVSIEMSNELLRYILDNKKGYTRYVANVAFNSSSAYTMRLYKYVCHWRDKADGFLLDIYISFIRKMLTLGDKYSTSGGILQRILIPSMKELEEKADIWFSIKEPIKEGRKVVGWKIQIHKKKEENKQLSSRKEDQESKRREAIFIEQERKNLLALAERFKNETK
ncbi:MAG: replication initiation protein [Bacteroidota bacterium]